MPVYVSQLLTPKYYNLKTTCHIHGWKNLAPFHWDEKTKTLHFALMAPDEPVDIQVEQDKKYLIITVTSLTRLKTFHKDFIQHAVNRALDLSTDTTELYKLSKTINPASAALIKQGAGRLLRAPCLWEDAAKTLFTTNCSWALTKIMSAAACSSVFSQATSQNAFPFPSAEKISRITPAKLKDKMRVGYRAPFIKNLAKVFSKENDLTRLERFSENDLRAFFSNINGFGPYATNHILILCGFYNQVPVDSVVRTYIQNHHATTDYADFIETHYGAWGEYKWWGMKLEQMLSRDNWLGD